jgi:hypothetical protein
MKIKAVQVLLAGDLNKTGFFRFSIFQFGFVMSMALLSSIANAGAPEAGDVYPGGSKVEYPDRGISYILPITTTATVSQQHPDFEMFASVRPYDENGNSGSSLHILAGKADFKTVAAELNHNAVIEESLEIIPTGKATQLDGRMAYNDFSIKYEDELKAFILMVIAENGTALMMTAVAPAEAMPAYKKAMLAIGKSVKIYPASNHAAQAQHSSHRQHAKPVVKAQQQASGHHAHPVVGVWMRRTNYSSSGIYIENSNKWAFSADGTVAWGSGAVVAGGTDSVSIRGGGDNPPDFGRWSTNGNTLKIQWNDGSNGTWTFSNFEYDGSPYLALTTQDGTVYRYRKVD